MSDRLAAARWTLSALRQVRAAAPGITQPAPPPGRLVRIRVIAMVLRLRRATCLHRSLVLQAALLGRGTPRDVVVGVAAGRRAHAWLDGEPPGEFQELHRYPATPARDRP